MIILLRRLPKKMVLAETEWKKNLPFLAQRISMISCIGFTVSFYINTGKQ